MHTCVRTNFEFRIVRFKLSIRDFEFEILVFGSRNLRLGQQNRDSVSILLVFCNTGI